MLDPRGRWFRVYARQVRQHPKFRALSVVELGAWLLLRSEAELRDDALFADRDEALLVLKRRAVPRASAVLSALIEARLFDETTNGVVVHDRKDHDRPNVEPEQQAHRRDHRRAEPEKSCEWCAEERWDRSVGTHGAWAPRDVVTTVDTSTVGGSGPSTVDSPQRQPQPQHTEAAPATEPQTTPHATELAGLPDEDDPVTVACRYLPNGGSMLSNADYRAAWDDLVRRFGSEWVLDEIPLAYDDLSLADRTKGWKFVKRTEMRLAERVRSEELARDKAEREAARRADAEHQRAIEAATPEQREQAAFQKAAIRIATSMRQPVPTEASEVRAFVLKHEPTFTVSVAP